ncbi:peptidoglycan-binding protein, partial [Bacillus salitolerans]
MQRILNKLGFNAGAEDGAFGAKTKNAVLLFEQFMGKSSDGVADKGLFYELTSKLHRQTQLSGQ